MRGSLSNSATGLSGSANGVHRHVAMSFGRSLHHGPHVPEDDALDVPGGLLEDGVRRDDDGVEVVHSTASELALMQLAHGVVLSDAQHEQALRLAKLYGDEDAGLKDPM